MAFKRDEAQRITNFLTSHWELINWTSNNYSKCDKIYMIGLLVLLLYRLSKISFSSLFYPTKLLKKFDMFDTASIPTSYISTEQDGRRRKEEACELPPKILIFGAQTM